MSIFLKKLALIGLLVLLVNAIGNWATSDLLLEPMLRHKIKDWKHQASSIDVLFLGSSRTYRQINPSIIDKQMARPGNGASYNFGMPSTFVPESYHVLELVLEKIRCNHYPVSTIVMELQAPDAISVSNAATLKGNYWLTTGYTVKAMKLALDGRHSGIKKLLMVSTYLEAYLIHHFGFNYLTLLNPKDELTDPARSGHLCLDEQLENSADADLNERQLQLMRHPRVLDERRMKRTDIGSSLSNSQGFNKAHLQLIRNLEQACTRQGIRLVFVLMPKQSDYTEQLPLANELGDNCIDLSSPSQYPEFWSPENSFDIGHLNCKGAQLLSETLAVELVADLPINP